MATGRSRKYRVMQRRYVLEEDRELPQDRQTVFVYALPTRGDEQHILPSISRDMGISLQQIDDLLLACLLAVENLADDDGQQLVWEQGKNKANSALIDALWPKQRIEVGMHILGELSGKTASDDAK